MKVSSGQDQAVTGYSAPLTEGSIAEPNELHSDLNEDFRGPAILNKEIFPQNDINMAQSMVTGSQMSYFCPKRFNRFPRFTIFFKKGQKGAESTYISQNTVSLNSDFLKFLSNKNVVPTSPSQDQKPPTG